MSDAELVVEPRKLPILWILAGLVLLLVGLFLFQLFAANSKIVVSKETTFITEPLGDDGLPDFSAYILEQDSEGVTPENNAAVLVWQATWPGELDQEDWLPMAEALGMKEVPSDQNSLVEVYDNTVRERVGADLKKHYDRQYSDELAERQLTIQWPKYPLNMLSEKAIDQTILNPWTSEQLPGLAQWAQDNQKPLDLLLVASTRARFFSPSPSFLDSKDESLLQMSEPHIGMVRRSVIALLTRSMLHLGERRTAEAWSDILACFRLSRHLSRDGTLYEQLASIARNGATCRATIALIQQENLSEEQAKQILEDLQALPPVSNIAYALDQGERFMFIDPTMRLAQGKMEDELKGGADESFHQLSHFAFDWNYVLREGNKWHDRIVHAAKLPTYAERNQEYENIENDKLNLASGATTPKNILAGFVSRSHRSHFISGVLLGLTLPNAGSAKRAEDRGNTRQQLTITSAALAVHRKQHGQYPDTLNELVPAILPQVPLDLYTEQPFIYQRKDDGYLLYSVSDNGIDDGGTSRGGNIINGEWTNEQPEDFDSEATDEVIRVPQPAFEFPELPLEELENQQNLTTP